MSELYDKIVSQRGSFERLLGRMAGFRGYLDKATRRTADQMLRDYATGRLSQRIRRFADMERRILDLQDGLSWMSKTSRVKAKIQLYHNKFNAVTPGYSGFAEAIKIEAEELDKLYSFDEAQLRYIDQLDGALDSLDAAIKAHAGQTEGGAEGSSIEDALAAIEAVVTEAIDALALRDNVITELSKIHGS